MKKDCAPIQEKIACATALNLADQAHLVECLHCQRVFADYETLTLSLEEGAKAVVIPDDFSDAVMSAIESGGFADDWYDRVMRVSVRLLETPLGRYGSIAAGFGVGIMAFVRFVAFVFIPA